LKPKRARGRGEETMFGKGSRALSSALRLRSRLAVTSGRQQAQQQQQQQQRRNMAEMPVPQSQNAKIFDGHKTNEGWEGTLAWWYISSFALCVATFGMAPDTNIQAWAQQEAAARLKLKEESPDAVFEFGKHYYQSEDNA